MKTTIKRVALLLAAALLLPMSAFSAAEEPTLSEIIENYPELVGMSVYSAANGSGYEAFAGKFQWDLVINKSVLDMTAGAGTSANPYYFDIYYKIAGSTGDYAKITCDLKSGSPIYDFQNGQVIYRLFVSDHGFTRLSKSEYEYVVVVRQNDTVVGWEKLWSTWTDKTDTAYSTFTGENPVNYTIIFNVGGYQFPRTCAKGTIPTYDGDLLRPGYEFIGWFGANKVYTDGLPAVTTNRTYTALYRSYAEGDVDGDAIINIRDVTMLLAYVADSTSVTINKENADLELDTRVTIADATRLLAKLASGDVTIKEDPVAAALKGKTALFCGDSITAASVYDTAHTRWGWGGRIAKTYGLRTFKNVGVDGASVSTCRSGNRIVTQVRNNYTTHYDFVMLHGGTNDGWDSAPVGEMTAADCFDLSAFDTTTYAGGLEELFYYATSLYPDSTIGYIINFRFNPGVGVGRMGNMEPYYTVGKQICEKWGIPYVSLFDNEVIYETLAPGRRAGTFGDSGIHPNSAGYDILYPYIAEFMASLVED